VCHAPASNRRLRRPALPHRQAEADGRTKTKVTLLDDRARTHEVARMVSGAKVTDTSLQHAAQMIAASR